jgi:DNA polymerase
MHIDFETYSEAGTYFNLQTQKFSSANTETLGTKKGITLVGAYVYAQHHSTKVISLSFSEDNKIILNWYPGCKTPENLLTYVKEGGIITAWNSFFEWCIWNLVCTRLYNWPILPIDQTRDTMARSLAYSLPGALDKASQVIHGVSKKSDKKIMLKLANPRNPTKNDPRLKYERCNPLNEKEIEEWKHLDKYCTQDVRTEIAIGEKLPLLSASELEIWKLDQKINARGIRIDLPLVEASLKIMTESKIRSNLKLTQFTNGAITSASQASAILKWVNTKVPELPLKDLTINTLDEYLLINDEKLPFIVKEVLKIRQDTGGNAPAKLIAMKYQAAKDHRVRGVFQYCGAQRTKRWAGRGLQTHNMPNIEIKTAYCNICDIIFKDDIF